MSAVSDKAKKYWIWLSSIEGVGAKSFYNLIAHFGDAETVWDNAKSGIQGVEGVGSSVAAKISQCRDESYIEKHFEMLYKKDIKTVCRIDQEYPMLLDAIEYPPAVLFYKGEIKPIEDKAIAMVGTRHCTRYGESAAKHIAEGLAQNGISVVSGMARGIDSASHMGCLEGGGYTMAVLGCGVDVIYPAENRDLYNRIIENGAVFSEYMPGVMPVSTNFPARNRIISGLAKATVVVEAPVKSGSNFTVDFALSQGRDVFALPGGIFSSASKGTNNLLKDGAKIVTEANDILNEYGWAGYAKKKKLESSAIQMDMDEMNVAEQLGKGDLNIDELTIAAGIDIKKLNYILTMMELRGIIKQLPGKIFTLV